MRFKFSKIEVMFLRYFLRYFIVSIFIFTSIFFIYSFIQIMNEDDIVKGISGYYLSRTLIYLLPSIIVQSLPFCIIFSIFFSVGELSSKGELIAIRVGGYSYPSIVRLLLLFILLLTIISYQLIHNISPSYSAKSKEYLRTMISRVTNINLKPGTFTNVSTFAIYSEKIEDNVMQNVIIFQNIENEENQKLFIKTQSKKGLYNTVKEKGIKITLFDGNLYQIDKNNYNILNYGKFLEYYSFIPFEIDLKSYAKSPKYISTDALMDLLKDEKIPKNIFNIKKEIYDRLSQNISIFTLSLLSIVLAFCFEKDSKYFSFLSSIFIIIMHYGINIIFSKLVYKNQDWLKYESFASPFIISVLSFYIYRKRLSKK